MLNRASIIVAALGAAFFFNPSDASAANARVMPLFIGRTVLVPTHDRVQRNDAPYKLTGDERRAVRKPRLQMLSLGSKAIWIAK